jgi:hypothetical protein
MLVSNDIINDNNRVNSNHDFLILLYNKNTAKY